MKHLFGAMLGAGALFIALSGRIAPPVAPLSPPVADNRELSAFTQLAPITDARLDELSGLAASRRYPKYLWAHNDSGDSPRLFLIDDKSQTRAVVNIANASALDWEDIAVAGKKRDSWIYIGDIGDNLELRDQITIYRLREPKIKAPQMTATAEKMTLQFPDGAHNCETLLANARGDLLLVTKTTKASEFFVTTAPFKNGTRQTLKLVGAQQFGSTEPGKRRVGAMLTTGGDLSPDGRKIAIVTYSDLLLWNIPDGDWTRIAARIPQMVPLPKMRQCESVTWSLDDQNLFFSSEGTAPPLWKYQFKTP